MFLWRQHMWVCEYMWKRVGSMNMCVGCIWIFECMCKCMSVLNISESVCTNMSVCDNVCVYKYMCMNEYGYLRVKIYINISVCKCVSRFNIHVWVYEVYEYMTCTLLNVHLNIWGVIITVWVCMFAFYMWVSKWVWVYEYMNINECLRY